MIALAVGLLLAGLGAEWWHRYTGTPEYSLSQLGKAVKDQNYGKASYYVDEERIASAISQSLTDVLLAKYTHAIKNDLLPFTETRIEILQKLASPAGGAHSKSRRRPSLTSGLRRLSSRMERRRRSAVIQAE